MRSLGTRDIEVPHRRAAQAMAELEAAHKAKEEGETRWRDAEEFSSLLELSDVLDPQTTAEQYTGKRAQDDGSGAFLDKNTEALAQALLKRRCQLLGRISSERSNASAEGRTCLLSPPAGTEMWVLPSSSVPSSSLKPPQKRSESGSIKCRIPA